MFTTRLISGIILVLLSIVIVGQGGILLYAVTALISIIGLFELYRALGMQRRSLAVVGYVTACSYYGLLWFEGQRYVTLMIIACLMAMMALYVLTFPEYKTEEVTGAFFGMLCAHHAVIPVSDKGHERRGIPCVAYIFKLLGLRYLCLLYRHAFGQA